MVIPRTTNQAQFADRRDFSERNQPSAAAISEKISPWLSKATLLHLSVFTVFIARVFTPCAHMVGNTAEAEDLTQEAFLMVLRKIGASVAFSTWLHRITVNLVLMRLPCFHWKPLLGKTASRIAIAHILPKTCRCRSLYALARSIACISSALKQLHPFQRLVVVLHDIQGYKHIEIAKMLDWSIGNSKSRLHRARARLRSLLPKESSFRLSCPNSNRS